MMHRQGNFYAANWPEGTDVGPDGDVNAFYLPGSTSEDFGQSRCSGGIYAAAFSDRPEVVAGDASSSPAPSTPTPGRRSGGFLSPNKNTDTSLYPTRSTELRRDPRRRPTRCASTPPTSCPARSAPARSGARRSTSRPATSDRRRGRRSPTVEAVRWPTGTPRVLGGAPGRLPGRGVRRDPAADPPAGTRVRPWANSSACSSESSPSLAVTLGLFVGRQRRRRPGAAPLRGSSPRSSGAVIGAFVGRRRQQRRLVPRRTAVAARRGRASVPWSVASCGPATRRRPNGGGASPIGSRPVIFVGPALLFLFIGARRPDDPHHLPQLPQPRGATRPWASRTTGSIFGDDASSTSTASATSSPAACSSSAVLIAVVGARGRRSSGASARRRGVDLSAPAPVVSLTAAAILVAAGRDRRAARRDLEQPVVGRRRHRPVARSFGLGHRRAGRPRPRRDRWPSR